MRNRSGLSTPAFLLSVAIGVALFTLIIMVMGTRLDTGPGDPEPPSAAEKTRQSAAQSIDLLARAADELQLPDTAEVARAQVETLGGVWEPWTGEIPEGKSNPPQPTLPTDLDDQAMQTLFDEAIDAAEESLAACADNDTARYASVLMSLLAERRSWAAAVEAAPLPAPMTADEFASFVTDGPTFERFATAQQWLEVAAARAEEESADSYAALARQLRVLTDAMTQAGAGDIRPLYAPLPSWFWEDMNSEEAPARLRADSARLITSQAIFLTGQVPPEARADIVRACLALTSRADTAVILEAASAALASAGGDPSEESSREPEADPAPEPSSGASEDPSNSSSPTADDATA